VPIVNKRVKRPISLEGCKQIFKENKISIEVYSKWDIYTIFEEATKLAENNSLEINEKFIRL